jgi:hypothetical protein
MSDYDADEVNQISRRCLSDLERIGEGSFGVVYKGKEGFTIRIFRINVYSFLFIVINIIK